MLIYDIIPPRKEQFKRLTLKTLSLLLVVLLISQIIGGIFLFIPPPKQVQAATQDWSFTTASNYTYDNTKIEISSGQAQLKATSTWHNASWLYRKKITIDNTKVDDDLTDFPVLVATTTDTDLSSNAQHDGDDILFTSSDGTTKIPHEIEKYASSTGELAAWVQSNLASTTDTELYMYYGNSGASDQQQATSVWDDNYVAVYHMNDDTTSTILDSTQYDNDGTKSSANNPNQVSGKIGYSQDFSVDTINCGNDNSLDVTDLTVEAWSYAHSQGGSIYPRVLGIELSNSTYPWAVEGVLNTISLEIRDGGGVERQTSRIAFDWSGGTWIHGAWTFTSGTQTAYKNSIPGTNGALVVDLDNQDYYLRIGNSDNGNRDWDGLLDEIRISDTVRSAEWISTSYNNQTSTADFYSLDSQISPFDTNNPTIQPTTTNSLTFTSLAGFTETATKNGGEIKYQISNDQGTSWYWWNSGWTTTTSGYSEANTAIEINTNISSFPVGSGEFLFKAYLNSDGTQLVQLDSISLTYNNSPSATLDDDFSTWESANVTVNYNLIDINGDTLNISQTATSGIEYSTNSLTWYDASWDYRKKITIDNTKVDDDLTDFPVLVATTADSDLSSHAQSDGDDILFTSSDGTTKLSHEIESYASSTGELVAWVKSDLASTTDTVLYMYYGNSGASNQENATSVWDSNYAGIWHMNETTGTVFDSTAYDNDATNSGAVSIDGKIGNAYDFEYSDSDCMNINTSVSLDITGNLTIEAWVNMEAFTNDYARIFHYHSVGAEYVMGIAGATPVDWNNYTTFGGSDDANNYDFEGSENAVTDTGVWYHVISVFDGTAHTFETYVNAISLSVSDTDTIGYGNSGMGYIGARFLGGVPNREFDGIIDEIRISNTVRSANWLSTTYNNQTSTADFLTFGAADALWHDASDAGGSSEGLTGLTATTSPGIDHVFIWDSTTDLPNTENSTVYLRIRPNDGTESASSWTTSTAFGLDNVAPSSVGVPTFGTITTSSIEVNKPATVTEDGSGLYQWQARRDSTTELGFQATSTTSITDSSLSENTQYIYDVQFRDNQSNTSTYGATTTKYTLADTPTNLSASAVETNSITLSVDSFPNDSFGSSGYYFSRSEANSDWTQTNSWQNTGLFCSNSYTYTVKYRNGDGTETGSISLTQSTDDCEGGGGLPPVAYNPPSTPGPSPENPQGEFKVLINSDDTLTNSRNVALELTAGSDTKKMAISNDPDFQGPGTGQITYQSPYTWDLCYWQKECPDGVYTVYAKFYTQWGQASEVVSDRIVYQKEAVVLPEEEKPVAELPSDVKPPEEEPQKWIIERLPEALRPLIPGVLKPEPSEEIPEVPIEELVPEEAPLSLEGKWDLLPTEAIERFVLAPLPREIRKLAQKFPELERTFDRVGIAKVTDVEKLKTAKLTLQGLTERLGLPTTRVEPGKFALPAGVPIAELFPQAKQQLPTEIVFARTGGELIDFNIVLTVNEKGEPQQKITTISGKPLQLVVKPDKPVESIKGYVVFKSKKPRPSSFQFPFHSLAASLVFANPVFAQLQEKPVRVEEQLVLLEFEYVDPDGDGIYTAEIQAPLVEGEYEIITVMDYEDPELGKEEIRLITVVDPEGYIYEKDGDKETRIPGAIVSIYWLNPETKQYEVWPAEEYQQENPQITDATGKYSFLVPEGFYHLKVEAPSYLVYEGKSFQVKEGSGVHFNIELKTKFWWLKVVDWKIIVMIVFGILLLYNFYRDKIREKLLRKSH